MDANLLLALQGQVIEKSPNAAFIADADRNIVWANAAFTRITGYALEEAIGRNPRLLSSGRQGREFYVAMWRSIATHGHWQGEIWNRRKNGEIFPEWLTIGILQDARGARSHYFAIFSDISEAKRREEAARQQARRDPLTGLAGRGLVEEQLRHDLAMAERNGSVAAVMFLDLDGLKATNDAHGHHVGDELLREAARRIAKCLRESDTVGRFGGDEFVVILPDVRDGTAAEAVALKIKAALAAPWALAGRPEELSASIGISLFPRDGGDVPSLLQAADVAMYEAKRRRRGGHRFFGAHDGEAASLEAERFLRS